MPTLTISEKAWDAVRPSSVKKTGLSETIRVLAKVDRAPTTPAGFDAYLAALAKTRDAIDDALAEVNRHKADDKKGAAASLAGWKTECTRAITDVRDSRKQMGLTKVTAECVTFLGTTEKAVRDQIAAGKLLLAKIGDGSLDESTLRAITQGVQKLHSVHDDGARYAQKDGFANMVAGRGITQQWGIDAADVPMPPIVKQIKANLDELQALAERGTRALEKVAGRKDSSTGSKAGRALIEGYREMREDLKAEVGNAKKLAAQTKALADGVKQKLASGVDATKLMPAVDQAARQVLEFHQETVALAGRGRSNGDLIRQKKTLMADLAGTPELAKVLEVVEDDWQVCMMVYRDISGPVNAALLQLERVARHLGETSPGVQALATKFIADLHKAEETITNSHT